MRRIFHCLITLLLAALLAFSPAEFCLAAYAASTFLDVPEDAWYAGSVYHVYACGLMLGTDPETFCPQEPMTRGMFVAVLYRLAGDQEFHETWDEYERVFLDTPEGAFYTEAALWAYYSGVTEGTSEEFFSPLRPIQRQEAAAMLQRYLITTDLPLPECEDCLHTVYTDADNVSPYAVWGVDLAYHLGLMTGYPDNCFRPRETMTRAEAAVVFSRLHSLVNSSGPT